MAGKLVGNLAVLQQKFKDEVYDREDIDPDDQFDWDSLTFGWALANGCSRDEAMTFSIYWLDESWY